MEQPMQPTSSWQWVRYRNHQRSDRLFNGSRQKSRFGCRSPVPSFLCSHLMKAFPCNYKTYCSIGPCQRTRFSWRTTLPRCTQLNWRSPRSRKAPFKQWPVIVGGRYGLGSKDTTPSQIMAVYKNLEMNEPKNKFTVGIVDDVTFTSLAVLPNIKVSPSRCG
jgi:hypothetical protein